MVFTEIPMVSLAPWRGDEATRRKFAADLVRVCHEVAEAVAESPRHREAGFMASRDELLAGNSGTQSAPAAVYGQMLWNYYCRSYPDVARSHYPDLV